MDPSRGAKINLAATDKEKNGQLIHLKMVLFTFLKFVVIFAKIIYDYTVRGDSLALYFNNGRYKSDAQKYANCSFPAIAD